MQVSTTKLSTVTFPTMSDARRIARLAPPRGPVHAVLDTDAYNEVDDQFAIVHALLSPASMQVEALYAAPFHNARSSGPKDGMEKSYDEILRLLERLGRDPEGFVFRGSTSFLQGEPESSEAVNDLVRRAMARGRDDAPLYVLAIGAITNVASAILTEPEIIERIVVVWLGGHAFHWPHTREFNLRQDLAAARVVFDSGVPLVQIPCKGVASHLVTTLSELDTYVRGCGEIGAYLADIVRGYTSDPYACSKVIWDIATVGYMINPDWAPTHLVHSPIVSDEGTWSFDASRHLIRTVYDLHRDRIFGDLFKKLETCG